MGEGQEEFMELLYWDCALQELYKYHANLQTGKAGPFIPTFSYLKFLPCLILLFKMSF